MTTFSGRLQQLRKNRGLTQTEFGSLFRLSKQTISGYEKGDSSPPIETLEKFADYFSVSTDYLLGRDDKLTPNHHNPEIAELLADNNIKKISLVRDLSIDEIRKLIELKNTILKDKAGN